ncbi:serine hydrolase domain-containing protein [Microbacterium invictum]|uniref:Methyl acetate hydrolase n=1 Tax=Microbacterium invictum TaxID=515415 RepID=A0AA40SNN7_9MICO|nr:serine hydrolase domain-containing protein [Microbacterium invictum]MBB4139440.1 methyl acetate hydrolase [Microbacterium invictum]
MRPAAIDDTVDTTIDAGAPLVIAGVTSPHETTYLRSAGVRTPGNADPATADTVIALYSVTKAFTATAALQCVEDGLIDLDAPARDYVPEIGDLEVLTALDEDGTAHTRPPVRDITPRMLLLHTSGLGYDMFDSRYAALSRRRVTSATPLRDSITTPLLHDPGDRWTYGTSMDWMGLVIAAVRGQRLEDVFRERIYAPCGMASTSFDVTPDMRARLATVHRRNREGEIVATRATPPDTPELDMGGQGLFSTVPDILALLRVWLGDGTAPGGQALRPETLEWAVRGRPGLEITPLPAAIPALTRPAEFFPGREKSWAYSFLVNDDDVPGRRRAGSLSWAGLGNVFYWIDRTSGVAAVWAAQLLPFFDPVAADGVDAFERAVYDGAR